ncbi:hypothetical protein [Larkinella sp. C7]|uniref:hypothetical protein n=1 Tax=Larkinella sp. C7 TaxID=2576607 RepID=UPI001110FC73|nr:hypothetical protein [Larkinella sp. C7]
MKTILIALTICLLAMACSKSNDPAPDAGTQVAGTYQMSHIRSDSAGVNLYDFVLPLTQGTTTLSGTLTARRDSAAAVFLTQTVQITGQSDQTSVIGEIHLKSSGSAYDVYLNNQKIGTADGTHLNLDDQFTDTQTNITYRTVITSQKAN